MIASPPAAPGMPSDEDIVRIIRDWQMRPGFDGWDAKVAALAADVLSLIRPAFEAKDAEIAAEKERADMAVRQMTKQNERVREMALLLDKQIGTPCEQIRHQQEVESLTAKLAKAVEDEREACAVICDAPDRRGREWVPGSLWDSISRDFAARIRARSASAAARGEP